MVSVQDVPSWISRHPRLGWHTLLTIMICHLWGSTWRARESEATGLVDSFEGSTRNERVKSWFSRWAHLGSMWRSLGHTTINQRTSWSKQRRIWQRRTWILLWWPTMQLEFFIGLPPRSSCLLVFACLCKFSFLRCKGLRAQTCNILLVNEMRISQILLPRTWPAFCTFYIIRWALDSYNKGTSIENYG